MTQYPGSGSEQSENQPRAADILNTVDLTELTLEDLQRIDNGYLKDLLGRMFEEKFDLSDPGHQNHSSHGSHSSHGNHHNIV